MFCAVKVSGICRNKFIFKEVVATEKFFKKKTKHRKMHWHRLNVSTSNKSAKMMELPKRQRALTLLQKLCK